MAGVTRSSLIVILGFALAAGIIALSLGVGFLVEARGDDLEHLRAANAERVALREALDLLVDQVAELQEQLRGRGITPADPTPPEEVVPPSPTSLVFECTVNLVVTDVSCRVV